MFRGVPVRDSAVEREWFTRESAKRNVARGLRADDGIRCVVCRAEYRGLVQHSTPGVSPLGRDMYVVTCSRHYCRSRAHEFAFWPVDQNTFGAKGNCFSACVAMMLELRIEDVPWFMGEPVAEWGNRFGKWASRRGYNPIFHNADKPPHGFSILSGLSPTYTGQKRYHSVLAYNGRCVWDPSWKRIEVIGVLDYVTLEPARCVALNCGRPAIEDLARGHTFCSMHARDVELVVAWDNL